LGWLQVSALGMTLRFDQDYEGLIADCGLPDKLALSELKQVHGYICSLSPKNSYLALMAAKGTDWA